MIIRRASPAGSPRAVGGSIALVVTATLGPISCTAGGNDDTGASIIDATVRVRADGCGPRTELGTGTRIDEELIVTAAHVVAGSDSIEIVDGSGQATTATVVHFDPDLDVAALRTTHTIDNALTDTTDTTDTTDSSDAPAPVAGSHVTLQRAPTGAGHLGVVALVADDGTVALHDVEVAQRVTIDTTDIYRERDVERPGLRITADIRPGDSGAMVHLDGGGVGIVWSRSTTTDAQAWTVDLPAELLDPAGRRALTDSVDTGLCP